MQLHWANLWIYSHRNHFSRQTKITSSMKTFLEYLSEATDTKSGNYVSIHVDQAPKIKVPETGKISKDYHVTLMYSKKSKRDVDKIKENIEKKFGDVATGTVEKAECFDSDENGTSCIVLTLDAPLLLTIHKYLATEGLKHSYDDYRPHLTLFYDVESKEAHQICQKINDSDIIGQTIKMHGIGSTFIIEDWNK
jgi:2'-5' RNA ligase